MIRDPEELAQITLEAAEAVEQALGVRLPAEIRVELNGRLRTSLGLLRAGRVELNPRRALRAPSTALRTLVHELVHLVDPALPEPDVETLACRIARDLEDGG